MVQRNITDHREIIQLYKSLVYPSDIAYATWIDILAGHLLSDGFLEFRRIYAAADINRRDIVKIPVGYSIRKTRRGQQ